MASIKSQLEQKIDQKTQQINELRIEIAAAEEYIKATREALRLMAKDMGKIGNPGKSLRNGSMMDRTYKLLKKHGKQMHIKEVMDGIGEDNSAAARGRHAGAISQYVRRGEIFTRPLPNTFGLVEWGDQVLTDQIDVSDRMKKTVTRAGEEM